MEGVTSLWASNVQGSEWRSSWMDYRQTESVDHRQHIAEDLPSEFPAGMKTIESSSGPGHLRWPEKRLMMIAAKRHGDCTSMGSPAVSRRMRVAPPLEPSLELRSSQQNGSTNPKRESGSASHSYRGILGNSLRSSQRGVRRDHRVKLKEQESGWAADV